MILMLLLYRESRLSSSRSVQQNHGLIEGFVELCCFHVWSQLL
jgi:hypothetical protein